MKIYIRSSEIKSLPEEYVIDVNYEVPFDESVVASSSEIKPVNLPDGSYDEQALADYDAFIDNIYASLCHRFEVVDVEESPMSKTSWYFWIYGKDANGNIATKFLVRLRISDHRYSERHSGKAERTYVDKKAQEYKQPASKKYQKWKLKNIIVNGQEYSTYWDAENAIDDEMEKLSNELNNKG